MDHVEGCNGWQMGGGPLIPLTHMLPQAQRWCTKDRCDVFTVLSLATGVRDDVYIVCEETDELVSLRLFPFTSVKCGRQRTAGRCWKKSKRPMTTTEEDYKWKKQPQNRELESGIPKNVKVVSSALTVWILSRGSKAMKWTTLHYKRSLGHRCSISWSNPDQHFYIKIPHFSTSSHLLG